MSIYRVFAPLFLVVLALGLDPITTSSDAEAQSLTRYGMWGNNVKRYRGKPAPAYKAPPNLFPPPAKLGANAAALQSLHKSKRRKPHKPIALAEGGGRPNIKPIKPRMVRFQSDAYKPGDIVIDTRRRKLFLLLANEGHALAYPIAVGKRGFTWTGVEKVTHIQDWPDWFPPEEMRERSPKLPLRMTGGVKNPLGAKAIYLGKTLYRIHGTNARWTIGRASSSGCFRMHNGHVVHLASLIGKNTTVHVLDRLPRGVVKFEKRKWKKKRTYRKKKRRSRRARRANTI